MKYGQTNSNVARYLVSELQRHSARGSQHTGAGFCAIVPTENICFQKLLSTLIHLRIYFVGSNYKKCHQNIEEKFTMQRLSIGID